MSADKDQIKKVASTISKREKLIKTAEEQLKDKAEALTIKGVAIGAQLESARQTSTTLNKPNKTRR